MKKDFHKRTYKERFQYTGITSEDKFEEWATKNKLIFTQYGLSGGVPQFYRVAPFVSSTPDYIVIGETVGFVECKGVGRGDHLKVKHQCIKQLHEWNQIMPVAFFFYDASLDKYAFMNYTDVVELTKESETDKYPESGVPYYKLRKSSFTWRKI